MIWSFLILVIMVISLVVLSKIMYECMFIDINYNFRVKSVWYIVLEIFLDSLGDL